ncbi:Pre-mRNA splicing factor PRP21 like protein-domain-containing protein [Phycomyces blakesleeanus]|uniref:Pre-mRNA splicing factor PRP21 like protein-domain-containing protein n=1 Tax=Phycomyces blakesleeanus TaxID=4837 RepID=A0ABR3BGR1_PHYBL
MHDSRFSFFSPTDPYHAYYQFKMKEAREGKSKIYIHTHYRKTNKQNRENSIRIQCLIFYCVAPQVENMKEEEMEEEPEIRPAPKEPEPFEFSAPMPAMSAQDLDIMKLTAQFAARNGRQFISQLAQRESRNYQFDFLRPSHSLFPYFTDLVKQYTKVLVPPKDLKDKLKQNTENKYRILDRVKERVEWVAWMEAEKKKKEDEDERERVAYASIDWHDFVIVETVEFTDSDEQADLPPPMSLSELENMSLAQKRLAAMPEPIQEDKTGDMEMDIDDVDMEEDDDDDDDEAPPQRPYIQNVRVPASNTGIKIRTDYKPRILGSGPAKGNEATQLCPRCGEAIPISEMDEHVRIELLDPKWKEQKLAMEAKTKDSNLLQEGTDVAKILRNFSGYRSDIFGAEETEIGKKIVAAEEEAKKKQKVVWDGHSASISLATQRATQHKSIDDQIAAIHRSKGFTSEAYGPQVPTGEPMPTDQYAGQPDQQQYYYEEQGFNGGWPAGQENVKNPNLFANQLPGMYNHPNTAQPPPPGGVYPYPVDPSVAAGNRKAEEEADGQADSKRQRRDNEQQ